MELFLRVWDEWTLIGFGVSLETFIYVAGGSPLATSLVLTLIGNDRPGLVEDLARAISEHGGSWESSRMARLSGCFAGILEVQVADDRAAELFKALHSLEGRGLRVVVEDASGTSASENVRELRLELMGQDRPGIIRDISASLTASGVNVVELSTRASPAPMSGETLFSASALLHHPMSESLVQLREDLERLAGDLMVEISVTDV